MSDTPATVLFADIAGFTALTEAHGDEQAVAVVDAFCAAVDVQLPAGGTRVKSIGDATLRPVSPAVEMAATGAGSCPPAPDDSSSVNR